MILMEEISAIATITELRSDTSKLVDQSHVSGISVLIQRNNEPYAVLTAYTHWKEMMDELNELRAYKARNGSSADRRGVRKKKKKTPATEAA